MDWKSSLEALKATLPQEEPPTQESNNEPTGNTAATRQPRLDIILDKKGRKGKAATIVAGFTIADNEIEAVSAKIKQSLGTGGSARGGERRQTQRSARRPLCNGIQIPHHLTHP